MKITVLGSGGAYGTPKALNRYNNIVDLSNKKNLRTRSSLFIEDNNSSFTYNGKSFDEKGKSSGDNSSCWGCFSIIIIIALLFGVYSYCSSWFDTQEVEQHQQDKFKSATIYVCMAKSGLIVRSAPDASSRKIGSLKTGEEVEVYDIIKDYAKIKFNGDIGYANIKYLEKK